MKKDYVSGLLILLTFLSACSNSFNTRPHLEMDNEKVNKLERILEPLKTSLSNYSLNIHKQKGITQIRIAEIDSLKIQDRNLNIYENSGQLQYDINEIDSLSFSSINIPNRPSKASSGSKFMSSIENMPFAQREPIIKEEILKGNIPDFFRNLCRIKTLQTDSLGIMHEVILEVMPDYLAIGSSEDFVRIPIGPQTAQNIADAFSCSLPTRKIVDIVYDNSQVKLDPITYYPVGNTNELVSTFYKHNKEIESKRISSGSKTGGLISGIKKDLVITNQIPIKPEKVAIYGWHRSAGKPIQPLYTGHINWYVDYSHGVRLINSVLRVDGKEMTVKKVLADPILYKLISDENGPMLQASYTY